MQRILLFTCATCFAFMPISRAHTAADKDSIEMQRYVTARLAEMDDRNGDALKSYLTLFKTNAGSPALTDRLFDNAVRSGDMPSAVTAVRMQELRNQADGTAPMLLYADAFRKKDWSAAKIAISELQAKSNYGFVTPILESWINVAQRKPHNLQAIDANSQQLLNYYTSDQRVYLEIASGNIARVKELLPIFINSDADFARDLVIRAAPVLSAQGESIFAQSALGSFVERRYLAGLTKTVQPKTAAIMRPEEGVAALYTRLAASLLEQKVPQQALILSRIANWVDPESDPAKLTLARALQENGQIKDARAILATISDTSIYWPRAVADDVRMLLVLDKPAEALQRAATAVQKYPDSSDLILLSAQMQENTGDYKSAAQTYATLASDGQAQNPSSRQKALYLLFLATAQDKGGRWQIALQNLEKAHTADPNNPYILNYLGYALLEHNEQLDKALEYLIRAHQLAPQSAAIADSLGWGYYLNGQYDLALPLLEKAVKQSGNDLAMNEHLGDIYWQLNRRIDARYAWKIAAQRADAKDAERLISKIDVGVIKPALKF